MLVNPGDYYLRAIDLATGVTVHESQASVSIRAAKTVAPTLNIALGFVRVSIQPEDGPMPVLSHLEIAVDSDRAQTQTLSSAGGELGGFSGMPLAPETTALALLLPIEDCTLRAYNGRLWMATGRGRAAITHLGEVEFTPRLKEMLRVELSVHRD